MKQLIETMQILQEKGIELKSPNASDYTAAGNRTIVFCIVASSVQFGPDNMIENTKAGLDAARARGKRGRRLMVMDKKKAIALTVRADPNRLVD